MKDSRLFATLLSPSPLSFGISCLSAALILLGASWSYLQTQPFFATYLSGTYGFGSLLSEFNTGLSNLLDSDLAYNIAVVCFAILFGMGIYAIATSVRHMLVEARTTLNEVDYADQRTRLILERSLMLRVVIRCFCGLVWLIYTLIFFNGILPFCSAFITGSAGHSLAVNSAHNLLVFVLLLLTIHIHVIFIRLIVLRPRLFSGDSSMIGRGGH